MILDVYEDTQKIIFRGKEIEVQIIGKYLGKDVKYVKIGSEDKPATVKDLADVQRQLRDMK